MQSIVLNINDDSKVQSLVSLLRDLQYVYVNMSGIEKKKDDTPFFSKPVPWVDEILTLMNKSTGSSEGKKWTREDLHRG
jgi:hypothetical protein